MSNEAINPITKTYPVFEANQVLSHDHLNGMRNYFNTEIHSTRNQLIGVGIVNGLDFELSQQGITINGGAGISTNGYRISSQGEGATYFYAIPYTFKDPNDALYSQVMSALTDRVIEGKEEPVRQTMSLTGKYVELKVGFYELVFENDPRLVNNDKAKKVADLTPLGKEVGLALYLETNDIDIESCFTTNCDDRGIERVLTVRPLLIVTNKDTTLSPRFVKPAVPPLPRIRFAQSNAPNLAGAFDTALNDGMLEELQAAIDRTDAYLGRFLGDRPSRNVSHSLTAIKANLLAGRPEFLPSFYEWIRDLRRALIDLQEISEGLDLLTHVLPDSFAQHLMLGPLTPGSSHFTRTEFKSAQPTEGNEARLNEIDFYWKRLLALIAGFNPQRQPVIKITPSHTDAHDLSDQSLPFYYDLNSAPVNEAWNYDLALAGKSDSVLGFHSQLYTNADHVVNPLGYEHEAKDALLVEGLLGFQKSEAIEALEALKKTHHLGFGIVALRVTGYEHDEIYPAPLDPSPNAIREDNFKNFLEENPGLYHTRGIRKNHTLALIFEGQPAETDGPIVAVMALPYICCGQPVFEVPDIVTPFILDAIDDEVAVEAGAVTNIDGLNNDLFDANSPIEVDLIEDFTLDAIDETTVALTGEVAEIDALQNDLYDANSPIEVDLLIDLDANDVEADVLTGESTDIDVFNNDLTDSGDIELDFADQP